MGVSFMMLGYSAYVTTMERSSANPALDMNKVDNPMSLVYYLGRDQYGSQPILYGTHFLAQPVDLQEGKITLCKRQRQLCRAYLLIKNINMIQKIISCFHAFGILQMIRVMLTTIFTG